MADWFWKRIFKFVNVFSLFPSFEQSWLPFSQGWFLLSLVEIYLVVLEKKVFKICLCILAIFSYYLPFEKDGTHHLNRFDSLAPKDHLCQVWLNLAPWFWRRRWKCEMFTTTTIRSEIFLNGTRSNKQSINELAIS